MEFDSFVLDWTEREGSKLTALGFVARRLVELNGSAVVLGRLGDITHISGQDISGKELIEGPEDIGFLTDMCVIDGVVYAAGMSRQIYMREESGAWRRIDEDVLDESISVDLITGFRSIDGVQGDVFAVGFQGEIWNRRDGSWIQVQSPTNVTLEQVKVIRPGEVYAVGQAGVIVHGKDGTWKICEQSETEDDFWGIEWFGDVLYLATGRQIFRFDGESELEAVQLPAQNPGFTARLRAGHGALWSFGPSQAFWTENGRDWNEARFESKG